MTGTGRHLASQGSAGAKTTFFLTLLLLGFGTQESRSQRGSTRESVASPQTLALESTAHGWATHLEVNGKPWELHLAPTTVRSPSFRVFLSERGQLRTVDAPPPATYAGEAWSPEGPGVVAASLRDGHLNARIHWQDPSRPAASIRSAPSGSGSAGPVMHIVEIDDRDQSPRDWCLTPPKDEPASSSSFERAEDSTFLAELAVDTDSWFYTNAGGNVDAAVTYIEELVNNANKMYERDVGIAHELTAIVLRPNPEEDPYRRLRGVGTLMWEMQRLWNNPEEEVNAIPRDVAHIMTGNTNSLGGMGQIAEVCDVASAYSSSYAFMNGGANRTGLLAHELGHNWGASHCNQDDDCGVMGRINNLFFGSRSQGSIVQHRRRKGCVTPYETRRDPPFFDDFEADWKPARWSYLRGAEFVPRSTAPSGTTVLRLSAQGPGPYDADDLRSNRTRLNLLSHRKGDVYLTYFTRFEGTESGELLHVQYYNSDRLWKTLALVPGVPQAGFEFHREKIPDDAFHRDFRTRWQILGDEADDVCELDDVGISLLGVTQTAGELVPGGEITYRLHGATPHEGPAWLFASLHGRGANACTPNGDLCFVLQPPATLIAIGMADEEGVVAFTFPVPQVLPADFSIATQAILPRSGIQSALTPALLRKP